MPDNLIPTLAADWDSVPSPCEFDMCLDCIGREKLRLSVRKHMTLLLIPTV